MDPIGRVINIPEDTGWDYVEALFGFDFAASMRHELETLESWENEGGLLGLACK